MRKGFTEQFAAFQRFSKRHKDARLALFTVVDSPGGIPIAEILHDLGILGITSVMPSFEQNAGILSEEFMARWYASLDLLSCCSYAEGFGIPLIEAQACGTPVAATDCSAMSELARPAGWLVPGSRYWNAVHRAWWSRPDEDEILRAWEKAYQEGPSEERRKAARSFAEGYSLQESAKHWQAFLGAVQDHQALRGSEQDG